MKSLGIAAHVHDGAFRDSPEERQIYEIGVKLVRNHPEVAKKIKANELGRFSKAVGVEGEPKGRFRTRKETNPEDEPWHDRIQRPRPRAGALVADLSD